MTYSPEFIRSFNARFGLRENGFTPGGVIRSLPARTVAEKTAQEIYDNCDKIEMGLPTAETWQKLKTASEFLQNNPQYLDVGPEWPMNTPPILKPGQQLWMKWFMGGFEKKKKDGEK